MFGRFQPPTFVRPNQVMFAEAANSSAVENETNSTTSASELSNWPHLLDQEGEAFENFPACGTHAMAEKKTEEWLHGEVLFEETNLHSKYLIVPEGVGDANAVIAVMCSLWNLQVPELFLAFSGGQDTAAGMLNNVLDRDVWQGKGTNGKQAAVMNFGDSLLKTSKGIATACSESKAWVFGFDGSYGCVDGDEMWGTCFNTGWSYFGQGRRSSTSCQSVEFICAKGLRGMFGERKFRNHAVYLSRNVESVMFYPSVSQRLQREGKAVPDCVAESSGKMNRPKRSQMIWPEFTHILLFDGDACKDPFPDIYETMRSITSTVHVLMGGVHPTVTNSVVEESEAVPVVILKHSGGSADVIAKALEQRQKNGDNEIEVSYTQSADELFNERPEWKNMKWSSMHPHKTRWSLPPSTQKSNFVIVDVKRDSIRNVVDKILHVFSYTDDMETRQPGAVELERDHLQEAWWWVVVFKHNANRYGLISTLLTYTIIALILLTVIFANLTIYAKLEVMLNHVYEETGVKLDLANTPLTEWLSNHMLMSWNFEITVIVLPCLVGFLQTCITSFSPHTKRSKLMHASNSIISEIYRYRMRMRDYARKPGHSFSVQKHIRRMPKVHRELMRRKTIYVDNSSLMETPRPSTPHSNDTGPPDVFKIDFSKINSSSKEPLLQGSEEPVPKRKPSRAGVGSVSTASRKSRRSTFHDRLEQIHTELANDVRPSSLADPPQDAVKEEYSSLVGGCNHEVVSNNVKFFKEDFDSRKNQDHVLGRNFDDGSSTLVVEDYIRFRIQPGIAELSKVARRHGHIIIVLEVFRYFVTMACIIAAMLREIMLVPTMVALICLTTNLMNFHQFSLRLQSVNNALTDLRNLMMWWDSLDTREQRMNHMKEHLVEVTEMAIIADFLVIQRAPPKPTSDHDNAVEVLHQDRSSELDEDSE